MADTVIGIMQGRLSPPENGRFQCFPRNSWREEFVRACEAGLDYIEWIYDDYGSFVNPISSELGISELNTLKAKYGIDIPAVCADWFMDFPLLRCTEEELVERELVLLWLLRQAKRIGASRVVLPFVDASSIRTEKEQSTVVRVLETALAVSEETGVEMHLEADFSPAGFACFLARLPHAMIKVNYDTGNSSGLGYSAREEFAAYGDRIGSIHIKDRLRKLDGSIESKPLGEGSANFNHVFECIREIGYAGGLTLQVARGKDGEEVDWAKQQVAFVHRCRN